MPTTYRMPIIAALVVALALAAYVGVALRSKPEVSANTANSGESAKTDLFIRDGYVLTGHPDLKANVWYFVHSQEGEQAKAAELSFDSKSICGNETKTGLCRPDVFKNLRPGKIEGIWMGEQLRVVRLIFTQPISQ